jgi:hypothetical protein
MPYVTQLKDFEYRPKSKKKKTRVSWVAPEHEVYSLGMERDRQGNLIVDNRPWILRPERPKIDMSLFLEAHL